MKQQRIRPAMDTWPRHDDAIRYVDALIVDLKLMFFDQPPNAPMDMTRFAQWRMHRANLEQCHDRMRFE